MKEFEIWTGYYSIDGYSTTEPELVAVVLALDFKSACMKYELASKLETINYQERQGYVDNQTYEWFYNQNTCTNLWTNKYYSSKDEAYKSFS